MILSDTDIKREIKKGGIIISPFYEKYLKPASYTFTLAPILLHQKEKTIIDAVKPNVEYTKIEIPEEGYIINPGDFFLGQTNEALSISTNIACILDTRTTLARIGLTLLQGSVFIEPGQKESHETLEMRNISANPILIYRNMKTVKCIFFYLHERSEKNYSIMGTYKKQKIYKR